MMYSNVIAVSVIELNQDLIGINLHNYLKRSEIIQFKTSLKQFKKKKKRRPYYGNLGKAKQSSNKRAVVFFLISYLYK